MPIQQILILVVAAFGLHWLPRAKTRNWLILAFSIITLYWLQPVIPIRYVDFWLPSLSILLSIVVWFATRPAGISLTNEDRGALVLTAGLVLLLIASRFLPLKTFLTASLPPPLQLAVLFFIAAVAIFTLINLLHSRAKNLNVLIGGLILVLVGLLILLKYPPAALAAAKFLRSLVGQNPNLATAIDIRWLGFSYISFRLIHVLRDRMLGRLSGYGLQTFLIYIFFFPAISAGPIDRIEHFQKELDGSVVLSDRTERMNALAASGYRILIGLFKKFVVADLLALVAISPMNSQQVTSSGWLWLMLYSYAFQIYFDFSGYTDIALGTAGLMGMRLPENFAAPYLKPNIAQFWNSWHITLTTWVRFYLFNPLVRSLRKKKWNPSFILWVGQVVTMGVIGLWHGISWNFLIWGLWHAVGLFVHNRWSEFVKKRWPEGSAAWSNNRWIKAGLVIVTFHYVALGWVWFVLPEPTDALRVFGLLFGGGG